MIALGIMAVIFGVVFATRGCGPVIHFFDLKVVNNTDRSVTIQPCWDLYCLDTHGLHDAVVRPGHAAHVAGHFANDIGQEIVVAIRKPGGKPWQFTGCLITGFGAGQMTGVVRVSQERSCFPPP